MTLVREFEIVKMIWHHNRGQFVFARHLGTNHDFEVTDGSVLGDVPIYNYLELRTMFKADGEDDMFVFRPLSIEKLSDDYFTAGQKVTLTLVTP